MARPLTESQATRRRVVANIKLLQGSRNAREMGEIIGKSHGTYCDRLKDVGKITLDELSALSAKFKVPIADIIGTELGYAPKK